jgi:hypothetical protein
MLSSASGTLEVTQKTFRFKCQECPKVIISRFCYTLMHTGVVTNQINKDGAVNIEETLNK